MTRFYKAQSYQARLVQSVNETKDPRAASPNLEMRDTATVGFGSAYCIFPEPLVLFLALSR
jgi:hypothetical protein